MGLEDLFSTDSNTIELQGMDSILKFTRFHPLNTTVFREGLELAENLQSDAGTILYPKGTEMSWERVDRLIRYRESNPELDFVFVINRTDRLIQKFRDEIRERLDTLLKRRKESKVTRPLFVKIDSQYKPVMEKALNSQNLVLSLYKMRFICELANTPKSAKFVDHALECALFSLAIATTPQFNSIIEGDEQKLCQIVQAALFHNYGAIPKIDQVHDLPANQRLDSYWKCMEEGMALLNDVGLDKEILQAIGHITAYQKGERGFVSQDKAGVISNILVVTEMFLRSEEGLFGEPLDVRHIVDKLNIRVTEKKLNDNTVKAITLGLNLTDIFDFYTELERLKKKCPYDSAVAYPLVGLYSPTIFVCKKNVTKCAFLELSVKAVNLVSRLGELSSGEYHRCKMLSPKLTDFYEEHYIEIKASTSEKALAKAKQGKAGAAAAGGAPAPAAAAGKAKSAEKPATDPDKVAKIQQKAAEQAGDKKDGQKESKGK